MYIDEKGNDCEPRSDGCLRLVCGFIHFRVWEKASLLYGRRQGVILQFPALSMSSTLAKKTFSGLEVETTSNSK